MRAIYDYIIYTDGGCECNPGGRGGYGAVIINNNTGELTDISGGFRSTTNNRMEVMAVIKALEKIEKDTHIQLFSDSQYVIKTMNGMFRKKKNIDLWKKLDKLAVAFKIEWNWVKGHNGNTYNERCDTLCQEAMTLPELEEDVGYMNTDSVPEQSNTVAQSLEKYNMYPDCSDVESYQEKYLVNPICAKLICQFYKQNRKKFRDYVGLRTDGTDFWSRKKKDTIMDIKEYSTAMEKRNRLLREMNEKVSEYPELEKVMETLGKMEMKSMNFIDLSAKIEITEEQLDDILVHNIQYFNMHEREGRVKVSLSPLCRKILNFKKKEGGCKN